MIIIKDNNSDENRISNKIENNLDLIKDLLGDKESILGGSYIYEGDPPEVHI